MIESHDGGMTWIGKPFPVAHIETACWKDSEHGLVVDRLGRVFLVDGKQAIRTIPLPSTSSNPILAAAVSDTCWWLAGAGGQVYTSRDGIQWHESMLPGLASDFELIEIRSIVASDDQVWMVGSPGNVVWHSKNAGRDWSIQMSNQSLPLHTICLAGTENLVAGGMLGNLVCTRNGGVGWWQTHGSGSRVGVLNVAKVRIGLLLGMR